MRVLITGGYGFIGSHLADQLYDEKHEIFIIDNLSTGSAKNVTSPHLFFNLDVSEEGCDTIFREYCFDVVVHLAAQVSVKKSIELPYLDVKTNILGLTNMLFLSSKYNVKKFIFASSAAVYGNNEECPLREESETDPVSPYGISKYVGELYCRKWNELYGLDTLCFRFSNVYGPRQGISSEGGVVSVFIDRILNNQPLVIYGDGKQTRDFIYVKDLADAIGKSIKSCGSGILNLSTNNEKSLNTLVEALGNIHPIQGIIYKNFSQGDILRSRLDNTKIRTVLDWEPTYTLTDGITKTFGWYLENRIKPL